MEVTKEEDLTYLQKSPQENLPDGPEPTPITPNHELEVNLDRTVHILPLHGFVDSNWALDTAHRKSITGIVYMMTNAVVVYKTKFQQTVAM